MKQQCAVAVCDLPARCQGLCAAHWARQVRRGSPGETAIQPQLPAPDCSVDTCARKAHARGYCTLHYNRWKRFGDPTRQTTRWATDADAGTKVCSRCSQTKPLTDYAWSATRGGTGHFSMCRPCHREYSRLNRLERYRTDPAFRSRRAQGRRGRGLRTAEQERELHLRRQFGIGLADYDAMLAAQGGGCAICGTTKPGGRWQSFCVDHDHYTGQVRGLLCLKCNTGVGSFGDNAERLAAAVDYLILARDRARRTA